MKQQYANFGYRSKTRRLETAHRLSLTLGTHETPSLSFFASPGGGRAVSGSVNVCLSSRGLEWRRGEGGAGGFIAYG